MSAFRSITAKTTTTTTAHQSHRCLEACFIVLFIDGISYSYGQLVRWILIVTETRYSCTDRRSSLYCYFILSPLPSNSSPLPGGVAANFGLCGIWYLSIRKFSTLYNYLTADESLIMFLLVHSSLGLCSPQRPPSFTCMVEMNHIGSVGCR